MERFLKIKLERKTVSFVLFCMGAVLVFTIFVKLTDFFVSSAKAEGLIKKAFEQNQEGQQPANIDQLCAPSQNIADNLKKRNIFAIGMAQREHPVKMVSGIFGNEVLINGRWYKLGEQVEDAQIAAIEPAQVKIKWQGEEKTFTPITNEMAQQPAAGAQGRNTQIAAGGRARRGATDNTGRTAQTFTQGGFGGFGGFGQMSEEDRAQMRQRMDEMRQRFQNMSEQEREDMRNQMRNAFGGRGGFGGGPGGFGPPGGFGGFGGGPGGFGGGPGGGGGGDQSGQGGGQGGGG